MKMNLPNKGFNFFSKLLDEKYNVIANEITYKHIYRYRNNGNIEIVTKLQPNQSTRIIGILYDKQYKFAFFKKNIKTNEFIPFAKVRIVNLPNQIETYLSPIDYFRIFATPHKPFNIFCPPYIYDFITKDL